MDSLSNGVPLVAIPIGFEQPTIAARIKWTGVGEVVPAKQLSISQLQAGVQKVLKENSYRENAHKLKASIQQAGGVKRAADLIEKAINLT